MNGIADDPVTRLRGVGPKLAGKLAEIGIEKVEDLLFHLPLRYQDRTRITPLGALQVGADAVIEGEVKLADIAFGRRRSLVCRLQDGSGTISLRFFHFTAAQRRGLAPGTRLRCYGEVRRGASGLEIYHPEYRQLAADLEAPVEETLTPVYPTTAGIGQSTWRKLCGAALAHLGSSPPASLLPGDSGNRPSLSEALTFLHAPPPEAPQGLIADGAHPAQRRLALEEFVAHNLSLEKLRRQERQRGAPRILSLIHI
mgnify:CR=1 FL=1